MSTITARVYVERTACESLKEHGEYNWGVEFECSGSDGAFTPTREEAIAAAEAWLRKLNTHRVEVARDYAEEATQ